VNLDCAEKNGEVMVMNLRGIEGVDDGGKTTYDGFLAFIEMHAEYMADDRKTTFYKCYVLSPHVLVMTVPSWSYPLLYHGDEISRGRGVGALPIVKEAFEDARLKYGENRQSRRWRDIALEFPPHVKLSAKLVNKDAGEDGVLKMKIMSVEYDNSNMSTGQRVRHYATFTVARTDADTRKRGKYEDEVTKKSEAADEMENLGIIRGGA
jgi:hypothetical protein